MDAAAGIEPPGSGEAVVGGHLDGDMLAVDQIKRKRPFGIVRFGRIGHTAHEKRHDDGANRSCRVRH